MQLNNRTYSFLLLIILLGFVILKIPDLHLPYFWDELGVYSRSSLYLAANGPGVMPANLPTELSRGHPLLFPFLFGWGYKIFGGSVLTGHLMALTISVFLLASLYYMASKTVSPLVGILTVVLLIAQPVFYAQATLVLPEIMMALFCLWALYAFYRKRLLWFALFACAAMMTKESALIIPATVIVWALVNRILVKHNTGHLGLKAIAAIISPLLLFGVFLLIQKQQNGWYFFPLHIGETSFAPEKMLDHFNVYRNVLLFDQGRYWWVKVILVALPVLVVKGKIRHVNTLGFLAILAIVVYGAFCVTNFFMTRYILMVLPLMALLVVWGVEQIWNNAVFMILIIALLGFASVKYMDPNEFNYDCDLSYKRMLNVEQQAATYIDNHISPDSSIASNFPMNVILGEKNTGFIVSNLYFTRASNPSALYIVEGNNTEQVDIPKNNYDVERSFKDGFAEVVLWKRR